VGRVINERTQQPVAGAQIVVEGTRRGVVSDAAGNFRIAGLTGSEVTLRVVMLGFGTVTQSVRVGDQSVRIALAETPVDLDALVVTGTPGATQKRAIGNSVARIDAASVVERQAVTDVGTLLQGRAAGIAVSEQMGVAGGGARIMVRGPGSLTFDGNPIVYVDGVRINNTPSTGPSFGAAGGAGAPSVVSRLNDISPQDIESIEVIKGPAAATLYGTQASAGVIHIITKRGRSGPMQVNAQIRQGAAWFNDAAERIPVTFGRNPTTGQVVSLNFVEEEANAGRPLFRTGHLQEYVVSLAGGTDAIRYYSGVDFVHNQGVIPVNGSERFSGRLNLSLTPDERFKADLGLNMTKGATSLYHALYFGSFVYGQPGLRDSPIRGYLVAPADAFASLYDYTQDVNRYQASVTLDHRPFPWFSHRLATGLDFTDQRLQILVPVVPPQYQPFFGPTFNRGSKSVDRSNTTYNTLDYSASAALRPTTDIGSTTSFGLQYYRAYTLNEALSGQQFPAPGVTTVSGAAIRSAGESFVENVTVGLYAQQQFSWKDRLFLTGAVRADDNSAFGAEFDLVTYPKFSASWVVSEEPFWNVGLVNTLKLRGAFGESGQQPASFAAIRTYAPIAGEGDAPAGTPQAPGNPELGPERGRELELGFESSLLDNRLGIDFTFYDQKTRNVIVQRNTSPSLGYSGTQFVNAGTIQNRGVELTLRGRPIATQSLDWDVSFNLGKNSNEVLELGEGTDFIAIGWIPNRHQVGFPLDGYFRKKVVSAELQAGRAVNVLCDGGTGKQGLEPGGAAVPCATAPYLYLGKPYYDVNGSILSSITFLQRLNFTALLDVRAGGEMFESLHFWNCNSLLNHEIVFYPERYDPKRVAECQIGLDLVGTSRIQDAGFTKLREVSLNYTVPERLAARMGAKRASVTLAARNLHTWTSFDGLDPETFTSVNWLLSSHTELVVPLPRTFMVTVNFGF
ncbi:MAG: TonB-dependent receptor domain-containing protein, partial [Longimicrobiales bacterium]